MIKRPPTIRDVADRAGVSVATVSRVMNDSPKVRDETTRVVREAMEQLNYRPSWLARDLRQDKTRRVLVLFPSLHSPVMADVFRGIDDVARCNDYFSLISPTAKDRDRELELVELLTNRSVDGIIFFGSTLSPSQLDELGQSYSVVQCSEWIDAPHTSRVSIDDYQAARDLASHLLDRGHTRIAMIGNQSEASGRLRESGFRDELRDSGVAVLEELIIDGDYEFATGRDRTRHLMSLEHPPTAICCISDVVAAGAVTEARILGLKVPQDVAIAGFDDSREATMSIPPLTTIRQPFYELGQRSMETMLHNLAHPQEKRTEGEVLSHELVIRASTTQ